tara:strand:+ start:2066 stop:2170 length:105 start_codon:yes stop_codon:yes gene_type:complete
MQNFDKAEYKASPTDFLGGIMIVAFLFAAMAYPI